MTSAKLLTLPPPCFLSRTDASIEPKTARVQLSRRTGGYARFTSTERDKQLMIELDRLSFGSQTRTLVEGTPRLEVAGVDERLIDAFSTRRNEMRSVAKNLRTTR